MASNINQVEKTQGEEMRDLLRRKPEHFDTVFSVGPEKTKAVKFVLVAASPVFEWEFEENWGNGVVKDENGIPLPKFDATVFQLFVDLLILGAWSLDSIKSLSLSTQNLLSLLGLCIQYKITKAIGNLEKAADDFIQLFDKFKDSDDFLKMPRENLETIFSFENIPLDENELVKCAFRWAHNQCTVKGMEPTGENYRELLGGCLFEIRFPTMTNQEFTQVDRIKKNVLNITEKLAVHQYIGLDTEEKNSYDKTQLPFKTNRRVANTSPSSGFLVLSLPQQYKLTTSPSFVCDGIQHARGFKVYRQNISLHGIGFLGPIEGDPAYIDVTVQIKKIDNSKFIFESEIFEKRIFAHKGKAFHFIFDKPYVVESSANNSGWTQNSCIYFSLKGPNNIAQYLVNSPREESFQVDGVQFGLTKFWNSGNPLAELIFKKTV